MGNGARAQQKRERNLKDAKGGGGSQLKANQAALTVKCNICMQTFMNTVRLPALKEHVDGKHAGKEVATCFPNYQGK